MTETKEKQKIDWMKIFSALALMLCAFSLALIAILLIAVAKWANYQTIWDEQEINKAPIEGAVRKCNGRSKVYQVK